MSDLISRLKRGFGSSAGRRVQVEAYQDICFEAQARIKELEDGIKAHKEDCDTLKNTLFNHDEIDSELHKLLEEVEG